jgi:hypothetical protein
VNALHWLPKLNNYFIAQPVKGLRHNYSFSYLFSLVNNLYLDVAVFSLINNHYPKLLIMSNKQKIYLAIGFAYALFTACSKNQADEATPTDPVKPVEKVSYTNFAGALLQTKCAFCHAPGQAQASLWTLSGYSSVVNNADRIKQLVLVTKTMPKGGSLSAAELASLQNWFDEGMLQ